MGNTNTHCTYDANGFICACPRHALEAEAAAAVAYRATRPGMSARDDARLAQGASRAAYFRALERPSTPCSDGSEGLGWPSDDD